MKKKPMHYVLNCLVVLAGLLQLIPIYILLIVSFKKPNDFSSRWLPPSYLSFQNYTTILGRSSLFQSFFNSFVVTIGAVIIVLFCGVICAYPISRIKNKVSVLITSMVLAVMMIPSLSVIVPLYSIMLKFKAINSYWGIILVLAAYNLPMSVFLFSNFIRNISEEMDEAASIDGCSDWRILFSVILPQLTPIVASVLILTGIKIWNDYKYALYFLQKGKFETITLFISKFFSDFSADLNAAAAAAVLAILPACVLFLCLQKYFISGISEGSIK